MLSVSDIGQSLIMDSQSETHPCFIQSLVDTLNVVLTKRNSSSVCMKAWLNHRFSCLLLHVWSRQCLHPFPVQASPLLQYLPFNSRPIHISLFALHTLQTFMLWNLHSACSLMTLLQTFTWQSTAYRSHVKCRCHWSNTTRRLAQLQSVIRKTSLYRTFCWDTDPGPQDTFSVFSVFCFHLCL